MSEKLRQNALLLAHAAVVAIIVSRVNDIVDEPYMVRESFIQKLSRLMLRPAG